MTALREWGDRWAVSKPVVGFAHDCGHPLETVLTCRHCQEPVTPASVISHAAR